MNTLIRSLLVLLMLTLSACSYYSSDELFAVPRTSESYENLQQTIKAVMQNASPISPLSGSNTQSIQLVNLDGTGAMEALAFYRDDSSEWPLKIAIFRQDEHEEYVFYTLIEGAGTDIESIEYADLLGDGTLELLVSWQVTPTVHTLAAYSITTEDSVEIMRSGYTRYLTADLNADAQTDLLLIQTDNNVPSVNRVEFLVGGDGAMELQSSSALSEGIGALQTWELGSIQGGQPALFVTSEYGENTIITDVFAMKDGSLRNITRSDANLVSESMIRQYVGISPGDINADGITDLPISTFLPGVQGSAGENFWQIDWKNLDADGNTSHVLSTYHNITDRWYIELPPHWNGNITLARLEQGTVGERAIVFSYWNGDAGVTPEPFLTIYRLTGNNHEVNAVSGARFVLSQEAETSFAAEFHDSNWDSGLDPDSLALLFHTT